MNGETSAIWELDRSLERGVAVGRLAGAVSLILNASVIYKRVRRPKLLMTGAGVVGVHALVRVGDLARRRASNRPRAASDLAVACATMVLEAAAWGDRLLAPEPPAGASYATVVSAALSVVLADDPAFVPALAAELASYLATTTARSAIDRESRFPGQRAAVALGIAQAGIIGRSLVRVLRDHAVALDRAREAAVLETVRLESERERQLQFRVLHDSALQTLESVGGGWTVDRDLLQQRISFEIDRMQGSLEVQSHGPSNLTTALREVADDFARFGLDVHLDCVGEVTPPAPAVEAVRDAVREALRNVEKHAGVRRADVTIVRSDNGVEVVVTDHGRGFEPGVVAVGLGLPQSIRARMADVGGRAAVTSEPGRGTRVYLWSPA